MINSLAFVSSYYVSSNDVIYHNGYGQYKIIVFRFAFDIKTGVRVVAWLSDNALVSINVVTLHLAWLIFGWVTVSGRVNHLVISSHLGQLSLSSFRGR